MARPKKEGVGSKPVSVSVDEKTMELIERSGKSPTTFFRDLAQAKLYAKERDNSSELPINLDFDISSLSSLSPEQVKDVDNCIFEAFKQGAVGFLTGEGGIGKTKLAINIAVQAISRIGFLGIQSYKKANVTYVTCEDSAQDIFNAMIYFSAHYKNRHGLEISKEIIDNLSLVDFSKADSDFLNGPMQDYLLANHAESDLFIFDTFSDLHSLDENSSKDMNRLMKALTRFAARTNSSVLILHHTNKASLNLTTQQMRSQSFVRGSSVIVNKAKFFIRLTDIEKGEVELAPGESSLDYVHATIGGNSSRNIEVLLKRHFKGVLEPSNFNAVQPNAENEMEEFPDLPFSDSEGLNLAFGLEEDLEASAITPDKLGFKAKEQMNKNKEERKSKPKRGLWNISSGKGA